MFYKKILFFTFASYFLIFTNVSFASPRNETVELGDKKIVNDVTHLNPIVMDGVIVPHSTEEISEAIKNTKGKISIGGGRYSMGGQTAIDNGLQIDMREFNKVLSLSTSTKEVVVQAGITWRDLQDVIDKENLSIMIMQTYSNFTVGGTISVNAHGRYIGLGPAVMSVKDIKVVLADGSIKTASPKENSDIFYSAIGGYGGIGVITEVTLKLTDNLNVERNRVKLPITEYEKFFFDNIRSSSSVIFHNGDMLAPDYDTVSAVSWVKTDNEAATQDRLIPRDRDYTKEKWAFYIMSEWGVIGQWIREYILEDLYVYSGENPVHSRNYEASYDVGDLGPITSTTTSFVLQEYFVPVENFDEFYPKMVNTLKKYNVNAVNISIRHANADPGTKLAWAQSEVFAFVLYYKQGSDEKSKEEVGVWTRALIDDALSVGGRYYLPYQPHATLDQFYRAYPGSIEYFKIKEKYDPDFKFSNKLIEKYYSKENLQTLENAKIYREVASSTKDYFRTSDNMYLALPEWYIVYSADEYARHIKEGRPSTFNYNNAVREYWSEYDKVLEKTKDRKPSNENYISVLKVIGYSFTFENRVKQYYENSIGRFFEWVSNNQKTEIDNLAYKMNSEYAKFIYDYPWYDFPYRDYDYLIDQIQIPEGVNFSYKLRFWERETILEMEIKFKRFYSYIIREITHSKFGVQDDIVYAVVSKDSGNTFELISAAHYQPLTRELIKYLDLGYKMYEISGNKEITFVYTDEVGSAIPKNTSEVLRFKEVYFDNGVKLEKEKITVEAKVEDLQDIYTELKDKNVEIVHFYDY